MGAILETRRDRAASRLGELRNKLGQASKIAAGKACVYVTGSFGRAEAGSHSDLDLFIVGRGEAKYPALTRIDEICLKAELISATRQLGFPEFSGDGEYLVHYPEQVLIGTLGRPDDDASNTFTARLLLLLESQPLIGNEVYAEVIKNVVAAYWRDYPKHKDDFVPAFLANDILRLWRTFCVNYEARTASEPAEKRAKRKLKNYKLKHSRLLTCYSGLLYLLAVHRTQKTVRPEDAIKMTEMSPTRRLEWILERECLADAHESIKTILTNYEDFLAATDFPEGELIEKILGATGKDFFAAADRFGDLMFEIIEKIGHRGSLHRVIVV